MRPRSAPQRAFYGGSLAHTDDDPPARRIIRLHDTGLCLVAATACKMPFITKDMVASYSVYYTIDGGAPTEAYSEKLHDAKMSPSQAP